MSVTKNVIINTTHLLYELLHALDNMLVELKEKQIKHFVMSDLSSSISEQRYRKGYGTEKIKPAGVLAL